MCIVVLACVGCNVESESVVDFTVSEIPVVITTSATAATTTAVKITSDPAASDVENSSDISYVRFSGAAADDWSSYRQITVGDTLCGMKVDYVYSSFDGCVSAENLTQTQVRFSGSVESEGWLYFGRNEQLCFGSSELEENILYFIPVPHSESDFPISKEADSRFAFSNGDISIDTDTEAIMLGIGDDICEAAQGIDFAGNSFVWAEVTLENLQLRYGIEWFVTKYETCATAVDIKTAIQ